jgi:predicted RNase H-like nuclease
MPAVLAIDAAWTAKQPSGVALVRSNGGEWRCEAVAPSYESFIALSMGQQVDWSQPTFRGSVPNADSVLTSAEQILGSPVDLVTIDMPVAIIPITGRRRADDAISSEFGARLCSAHTPNALRPGSIGAELSNQFAAAGYPLVTSDASAPVTPSLIEVYPHPALLSLMERAKRVCYKVSKSRRYWPLLNVEQRIDALLDQFRDILTSLTSALGPMDMDLPPAGKVQHLTTLKRYEDGIDALVCAWVGVQFLLGRAVPLGDHTAAIWCPSDVVERAR